MNDKRIVVPFAAMDLRDYFAAAALIGILSNTETMRQGTAIAEKMSDKGALQFINSMLAFAYADAMLAERAR